MSPRQRLIFTLDHFLRALESREEQIFLREMWALAAHDAEVAAVMNTFYKRWIDLAAANLLEVNPALGLRRAQRRALLVVSAPPASTTPRSRGSRAKCAPRCSRWPGASSAPTSTRATSDRIRSKAHAPGEARRRDVKRPRARIESTITRSGSSLTEPVGRGSWTGRMARRRRAMGRW
jgi:hypothetical protein